VGGCGAGRGGTPSFYGGGGGGGLAAGGAIFVAAGATLLLTSGTISGNTVTGGAGGAGGSAGTHGAAGGSFGSGIFLGGNAGLVLAPPAGQLLEVDDSIADQSGSGGTGANAGAGYLAILGGGTVRLNAANSFVGSTFLQPGATLELAATGAAGSGVVEFLGAATLRIDPIGGFPNLVYGLVTGAVIDFPALPPSSVSVDFVTRQLGVDGLTQVQLDPAVSYNPAGFAVAADGTGGTAVTYTACFAECTRIDTIDGPVAVEDLQPGARVLAWRQGVAEVRWTGHRRIDCARHPRPWDVWPIRVRAGAFGADRPHADVVLSPDHAVLWGGTLIPVRYLVNGATVVQEPMATVTYWHVELPEHDVMFAAGLEVESYLDTGNRAAFANGGPATMLHANFARGIWATRGCAPLAIDGEVVQAARMRLREQAPSCGYRIRAAAPRIMASGRTILPVGISGDMHRFIVPARQELIEIVSSSAIPAEIDVDGTDTRRLGVMVTGIVFRHVRRSYGLPLGRIPEGNGFHHLEHAGKRRWRWTSGAARLAVPATFRDAPMIVDLRIAAAQACWVQDELCAADLRRRTR